MFKGDSKKGAAALAMILILVGVFAMTAAGASVLEPEAPLSDAKGELVATLSPGEFTFWDHSKIEEAGVDAHPVTDPAMCQGAPATVAGCLYSPSAPTFQLYWPAAYELCEPVGNCINYFINVEPGGSELVVSLDHPTARNQFELNLFAPKGAAAPDCGTGFDSAGFCATLECPNVCNTYELATKNPVPGQWKIRVVLHNVRNSGFRMRAFLGDDTPAPGSQGRHKLLPNLQVTPPFELGFTGCTATEIARHEAERCLRFSTGPANAGEGPLDLRVKDVGVTGTTWQRIHYSDGTVDPEKDRPAGEFEWHAEHGHYHHEATGGFQLFRVEDERTGKTIPASEGWKMGFCMGDGTILYWDRFDIGRQFSIRGECDPAAPTGPTAGITTDGPMFAMSSGWSDIYPYWVEGNYFEAKDLKNGHYVARATSDPDNVILESNEKDNVGYTYFELNGNTIRVIERGLGESPWDKKKEIVDDTRWPTLTPR